MITQDDLDLAKKAQDAIRETIKEFPDADSKTLETQAVYKIGQMPMQKLGLVANEINLVIREYRISQKRGY